MAVLGLRFCTRAFSSCGKRGPLFIAVRRPLTVADSLVAEHRLQTRRLSNCDSRAQSLRGMWDLPRPGLEPVSPALAGRLSTTAPPGKPPVEGFNRKRLTFWEREFCQQSAFRLKLQLFPGSLACWPTLHILDLPSLCNRVSRFLKVTQPFSLYLSLNLSLQDVCPTHMYILFCFSQEP